MYYLPLSIDAYESARQHHTLGKRNLQFVVNNILDAILYDGEDNELTNWAKRNTLNMLHLIRFLNYCKGNCLNIVEADEIYIPDYVEPLLGANKTEFDYSEFVVDGKITININGKDVRMDMNKPSTNRESFPIAQPIPVSSEHLRDNIIWYSKMYYYLMLKKAELEPEPEITEPMREGEGFVDYINRVGSRPIRIFKNSVWGEPVEKVSGGVSVWGEEYDQNVRPEDEDEFMTKINELINTNPEIL